MATTVPQPPKIGGQHDPSRRVSNSGGGGWRNLVPSGGDPRAVMDYSPPPASTGIWVVLASITMTFLAFTSALVVRQGSASDWRHLTLPAVLYLNTVVLLASSFTLELARRQVGAFMAGLRTEAKALPAGSMSRFSWACFLWPVSMSHGCNCDRRACFWPPIPTARSFMC